jgi:nicotinamide-nucleotide amidase
MTTVREVDTAARDLVVLLKKHSWNLVLAESCTGGLIAATLTKIPGVAQHFCGSAVTYQLPTKSAWLGIPAEVVAKNDAVTREVAEAMAVQVLERTPQADIAAAVTGHLGPNAPKSLDGLVFVAVAVRAVAKNDPPIVRCGKYRFTENKKTGRKAELDLATARKFRHERQRRAAQTFLVDTAKMLRKHAK